MNEYEDFALGNTLSCWDENATYQENLEAMRHSGDCEPSENCKLCHIKEEICEWQPFEDFDNEWLIDNIESMKESCERRFMLKPDISKCEQFALRQHLKYWDKDATYQENIDAMNHAPCFENDCDNCTRLELIEGNDITKHFNPDTIAKAIEQTLKDLIKHFTPGGSK